MKPRRIIEVEFGLKAGDVMLSGHDVDYTVYGFRTENIPYELWSSDCGNHSSFLSFFIEHLELYLTRKDHYTAYTGDRF